MTWVNCQKIRKTVTFENTIDILRANFLYTRQDSMEISFEAVSTQWRDYLLILVFGIELWGARIMSSENATFVKNSISNKRRELVKTDIYYTF